MKELRIRSLVHQGSDMLLTIIQPFHGSSDMSYSFLQVFALFLFTLSPSHTFPFGLVNSSSSFSWFIFLIHSEIVPKLSQMFLGALPTFVV